MAVSGVELLDAEDWLVTSGRNDGESPFTPLTLRINCLW